MAGVRRSTRGEPPDGGGAGGSPPANGRRCDGVRFRSTRPRKFGVDSRFEQSTRGIEAGTPGCVARSGRPALELLRPSLRTPAVTDTVRHSSIPAEFPVVPFLKVRGHGGLLDGEFVKVPLLATVTLGRSKRCGFSLKRSARYLLASGAARAEIRADLAFRSVSRHHCSVTFLSPDLVEIENHSPNGTFVDGRRVSKLRLDDVRFARHELRLGSHGDLFEVEYGSLVELPEDSVSS